MAEMFKVADKNKDDVLDFGVGQQILYITKYFYYLIFNLGKIFVLDLC